MLVLLFVKKKKTPSVCYDLPAQALNPVLHAVFDREPCASSCSSQSVWCVLLLTFLAVRKCRQNIFTLSVPSFGEGLHGRERCICVLCWQQQGTTSRGLRWFPLQCRWFTEPINWQNMELGLIMMKVKISHWLRHNTDKVSWSARLICVQCNGLEKARGYKSRHWLCRVCWPKWAALCKEQLHLKSWHPYWSWDRMESPL